MEDTERGKDEKVHGARVGIFRMVSLDGYIMVLASSEGV